MMKTQYSNSGTDASPQTTSPSLSGVDFSDPDFSNFIKVSYKGALGIDDTWAFNGNWLKWN